jgi:uncharacterized protein involved in outer membrane biogenesis
MKKSLKFLLLFLIASVVAVLVLVQSFKNLAEKNREQVHQELQRFLGKEATFDRLEASLWGGVGFSAEEFRIADNPRFAATPIVRAKELKLGVSLIQLVLGRIVINSLTFQAPEFQIITDERGLLNLSEFVVRKSESRALPTLRTASPERKLLSVSFLVNKVKMNNGRVDFIDRSVKEPAEIRVKNVEMEIKGLNPTEKSRIRFAAAVTEGLGHDVRIDGEFGPLRQPHDWSQQPVELEMRFDSLRAGCNRPAVAPGKTWRHFQPASNHRRCPQDPFVRLFKLQRHCGGFRGNSRRPSLGRSTTQRKTDLDLDQSGATS